MIDKEIVQLQEELAITDKLLDARNATLALPDCSMHGPQCLPHMEEWIEGAKAELEYLRGIEAALMNLWEVCGEESHRPTVVSWLRGMALLAKEYLMRDWFSGLADALEKKP